MVLLWARS